MMTRVRTEASLEFLRRVPRERLAGGDSVHSSSESCKPGNVATSLGIPSDVVGS